MTFVLFWCAVITAAQWKEILIILEAHETNPTKTAACKNLNPFLKQAVRSQKETSNPQKLCNRDQTQKASTSSLQTNLTKSCETEV
jgi:hypothetical protein